MRLLLGVTLLVVVAVTQAQIAIPKATDQELVQILSTEAGAKEFVNCVIRPRGCRDGRAHDVARLAPILFRRNGRCKGIRGIKCTDEDETKIRFVVGTLSTKYPKLYDRLLREMLRQG